MLENGIPQGTQNFGIFDKYYPSRRIIRRIIHLRRGIRVWKWDCFSFWANNLPGHPYLVWFYSSHYFLILTDLNTDYPPTWNLRKQPTFREATNGFFVKWAVRNERRNSMHPDDVSLPSGWNFCARPSVLNLQGNRRWRRKMTAFFSGWNRKTWIIRARQ